MTVDSLISKVQRQCQELLQKTQASILELTKLIALSSTIQAVHPAQINFRYLQQQMQALKTKRSYCKKSDSKQTPKKNCSGG